MEYLVSIIGRVVPSKRLGTDLPDELRQVYNFEVESPLQLIEVVMKLTKNIIDMQGMIVKDDPFSEDATVTLTTDRKWVPMHMIAYLSAKIERVNGESPIITPEGKMTTRTGKDVLLQ
jgi:predicted regulator of amino acid metabolism with ACT domain